MVPSEVTVLVGTPEEAHAVGEDVSANAADVPLSAAMAARRTEHSARRADLDLDVMGFLCGLDGRHICHNLCHIVAKRTEVIICD